MNGVSKMETPLDDFFGERERLRINAWSARLNQYWQSGRSEASEKKALDREEQSQRQAGNNSDQRYDC